MKKVLIIDDRQEVRMYMRVVLMHYPLDIVEAATLEGADEVLAGMEPDLVFVDINFNGRPDGLDYCRRLSDMLGDRAYVVLCTGYRELIIDESLADLGADAVLLKPFSPTELMRIVHTATGVCSVG